MIVAKVVPNQNVQLFKDGQLLKEFDTGEVPADARALLARINKLCDFHGNPIYGNYRWGKCHLWALHQEELFNAYCRPFVAYRALFEYIELNCIDVNRCEDNELSSLNKLMQLWQADPKTKSRQAGALSRLRNSFVYLVKFALYFTITALTLIRLKISRETLGLFSYDTIWGEHRIDRRLKDVYAHLFRGRIPFIEIFPALTWNAVRNMFKRRRLALYYPPVKLRKPEIQFDYDLAGLDPLEQKFVRSVLPLIEKRIDEDRQAIPGLAATFKRAKLRKIFSIDDSWTSTPLIVASKTLGIELTGMQHGYFCKYHPGHLQSDLPRDYTLGYPKILVWGESSKEILLRHSHVYDAEKLVVAGYIRPLPKQLPALPHGQKRFRVLYPFEFLANAKDIAQYIETFLKKGYEVTFKVRWDTPLDIQLAGLPGNQLKLVYDLDQNALRQFDVCVGTSTSFLHEMYYLGVPLWYLNTRSDYLDSLVDQGFAQRISLEELQDVNFNPYSKLMHPRDRERLYASQNFFDHITLK